MISPEIMQSIKQIEIRTRRLLRGSLVGDSRSALKGSGFEFDQIRDYQMGDDVRFIDWKSSSRMNKLLVKQYREERSRCVIIVLDVSASNNYSSKKITKYNVMAEIACVLAFIAHLGKDLSSLILFGNDIERVIPAGRGQMHAHHLMQEILSHKTVSQGTRLQAPLEQLLSMRRRDAVIFFISDFISQEESYVYEKLFGAVAKRSDLVAIRCTDDYEHALPKAGFLLMQDCEEQGEIMIDMRSGNYKKLSMVLGEHWQEQQKLLKKYAIDSLDIVVGRPFIPEIMQFFRRRMMY